MCILWLTKWEHDVLGENKVTQWDNKLIVVTDSYDVVTEI